LVRKEGVGDRVTFAEPVPVDELVSAAGECDIGLSPFISVCRNTEYSLPNKFFEYMTAGLALVSADLVEMRGLTRRHGLGEVYDPTDVRRLSEILNELASNPGKLEDCRRNAHRLAREELHWEKEREKLLGHLAGILG
ncbi:MAG: glycosyltransferase, partial [Planctomycetota bacterium]